MPELLSSFTRGEIVSVRSIYGHLENDYRVVCEYGNSVVVCHEIEYQLAVAEGRLLDGRAYPRNVVVREPG